MSRRHSRIRLLGLAIAAAICLASPLLARVYEIRPAAADQEEEFEKLANALSPGDELILHGGTYSQKGRRSVTAKGTPEQPIIIRAAIGESPLLTQASDGGRRQNNIEFIDCAHLVIRGLRFQGGSSGVRFIRGQHVVFEDCEISDTSNNALTMNSGNCDSFIIRRNHIHHTGLSASGATEGEGMYIGCHDGSCRTTNSTIEGNYIHHLRGTSSGGNDGIEIKFGSEGNVVRNNVIHDTNIDRKYPGIFVYGGGARPNIVEGNVIWNAGEGIQVVSDAIIRNNIIFDCSATGITAAPHDAVPQTRNTAIINNTIFNAPIGIRVRWSNATNMVLANNAIYCPGKVAVAAPGFGPAVVQHNYVHGRLTGIGFDNRQLFDGGDPAIAFVNAGSRDFWPGRASPLKNHAHPEYVPPLDFNGTKRKPISDIGALEANTETNPGWIIKPGFKH